MQKYIGIIKLFVNNIVEGPGALLGLGIATNQFYFSF